MNAVQHTPIVTVVDGSVTTLSTDVAMFFGKEHKNVLQAIEKITRTLDSSRLLNFQQTEITRASPLQKGAVIKSKAYRLTRDGFTFLAMGFTGARAQEFKWAYIDAFNKMESALRQCPAQAQLPAPTLTEQQSYQILSEVAKRCKRNGVHYQTLYRSLKKRYQVTKYTHILQRDFEDALEFIRTVDLRTPVVSEHQSEEPPAQDQKIIASPEFCEALRRFVYEQRYLFPECFEKFYRFLQLVNSPLAGRFYESYTSINLASLERSLASVGYPVDELVNYKRTPKPIAVISR